MRTVVLVVMVIAATTADAGRARAGASGTCGSGGTSTLAVTANGAGLFILDVFNNTFTYAIYQQGGGGLTTFVCTGPPTPTPFNIDAIEVTGDGSQQSFELNFRDGLFAPGDTPEIIGASEIEVDVDLGGGIDHVVIRGTEDDDVFHLGTTGVDAHAVNVNGDPDRDIDVLEVEKVFVHGDKGNDLISGMGQGQGSALEDPLDLSLFATGFNGRDILIGGLADDDLLGYNGRDRIDGGPGVDTLRGLAGRDKLIASDGTADEEVSCGSGNDRAHIDGNGELLVQGCEKVKKV